MNQIKSPSPDSSRRSHTQSSRLVSSMLLAALFVTSGLFIGCSRSGDAAQTTDDTASTTTSPGSSEDVAGNEIDPSVDDTEHSTTGTVAVDADMELPPSADMLPVPIVGAALPPVRATESASLENGVAISIVSSETVDIEARIPGETSGPATVLTLKITNGTTSPIDLSAVLVDLLDDEGRSFTLIDSADLATSFDTPLKPGGTSSASFVFRPGPTIGSGTYLTVKYATDEPSVVFAGRITND